MAAAARVAGEQRRAIHHSDQGKPVENGYAEHVIRTMKEEEMYLSDNRDFEKAYIQIRHFIEDLYQTSAFTLLWAI